MPATAGIFLLWATILNLNAVGLGGQRLGNMEPACWPFLEKQFASRRTGTNYFPPKSP